MKIPKGVPDPKRVPQKIVGPTPKTPSAGRRRVDAKTVAGTRSEAAGSSSNSLGLMMLMEMHKAGVAEIRADREAKSAAHQAKTGKLEGKKAQLEERQAKERDAAWLNVGMAVASASSSAARAAAGAVGGATSAAGSALQRLAIGQRKALVDTIGAVKKGATDAAKAAFEKVAEGAAETDVNGLVQHVLKESYLEPSKDLASLAEKVKASNDQKASIQGQITRARSGDTSAKTEAYIESLEEKLATVGDDAQLANIDLQSMLQKQQQTLQLMSNVSKMLHDTGMAVVRKIG